MLSYCTANPTSVCLTQKTYFPSSSWQICHFCYKRATFFLINLPFQSQRFEKKKKNSPKLCSHVNVENLILFSDCYIPPPHALSCPLCFFLPFLFVFDELWWGGEALSKEKKGLHSYSDELSKTIMN